MNPIRPRAGGGALGLALVALPWTLGAGCGLFDTREPVFEEAQESEWTVPTSPEIVVENLARAFELENFTDYERALNVDFQFHADPGDVDILAVEFPGDPIFEAWDRTVESATASDIRATVDSLALELTLLDDDLAQDLRLLKYQYELTLYGLAGDTIRAGEAWFEILQDENGEWYILDWEDVANSSQHESWGLLKGRNRSSS